jgi:hypothetical protein
MPDCPCGETYNYILLIKLSISGTFSDDRFDLFEDTEKQKSNRVPARTGLGQGPVKVLWKCLLNEVSVGQLATIFPLICVG